MPRIAMASMISSSVKPREFRISNLESLICTLLLPGTIDIKVDLFRLQSPAAFPLRSQGHQIDPVQPRIILFDQISRRAFLDHGYNAKTDVDLTFHGRISESKRDLMYKLS